MLSVQRATCSAQVQRHGAAVSLPAGLKRSPLLSRRHSQPLTTGRLSRTAALRPRALFYPSSGSKNLNRIAAAPPQARQALLSSAISSCKGWRQLGSLVEAYGPYLSPNNISHCLTRLEQLLAAQQLTAGESEQIEVLLEWLLRRGREMNASAQLGPQALGATAGALARLQEAQQQQQQQQQQLGRQRQQQQQQQQQVRNVRKRVVEEDEAMRSDAVADRRQLMQQLVDAAVAQRSRLSPQALNDILSGLASIDESGMPADQIRKLLNIPTEQKPRSRQAVAPAAMPAPIAEQRAQQQQRRQQQQQQQQQQRVMVPGELQRTAGQLGQLSPELAQEWHDRALRQSLNQGALPAGVDQRYLSGFLAREIDRAAERARESNSSSSGRAIAPSGDVLLQAVLVRYAQLLGVAHLALAGHRLAELQQEGLAGTQQEVEAVASRLFQLSQARMSTADAASLSSLVSSCKELRLYSENLLSAALARAKSLMQQQLQGGRGFSARQLGVLLHSLAVLGLKPSDGWLRLAVTTAGQLLPSCSLTDLERLASSLVLMRTAPGRDWTAAAEAQLEQLATAIGSSAADPARARALVGGDDDGADHTDEEDEAGEAVDTAASSNARKALVACVKSVALLGGPRATAWYRDIVAEEEQRERKEQLDRLRQQRETAAAKQQQLQQQEQQRQRQREIDYEHQRQKEQRQQRQVPAATREDVLTQQLRKAMTQQRRGRSQQALRQQQQQHMHQAATSSSNANRHLTALSSLDDMMSQALQKPEASSSSSNSAEQSSLPHATISIAEDVGASSPDPGSGASTPATGKPSSSSSSSSSSSTSSKNAGQHSSAPSRVEAAAPAAWAAEQAARWADTEGEHSPAAELQQQLDDSQELFGAGSSKDYRHKQQRQQRQQSANKPVKAGTADTAREIEVEFDRRASKAQTSSKDGQPARSAADAASALAAMMAEVDQQEVDKSAQQEVLRELGLRPDAQAGPEGQAAAGGGDGEGAMSVQDIQAAADAVKQATQQLDELDQRQQQQAAAQLRQQQEQEENSRLQKKQRKDKQETAAAAAAAAKRRPLGSSGEAAYVAAAKHLSSSRPSRNYLLGCLEAIEMQQQQLKQQLAEKQALAAVAGAAQRQRAAAKLDANPLAKKIAQLQQDFDNARKRAAADKASVTATAVADVAAKLLPLLDSFDAALAAQQQLQQQGQGGAAEVEAAQIHTVYTGLHNQLLSILKAQGVTVVGENDDVVGHAFDPNHMEAVMRQPAPDGFADGDVLRVLRKGYSVGERLVRPALVIVAYED